MTTLSEAKLMSKIGSDVVQEGWGESIIRIALALVSGQVPPQMEMAVATQVLTDCAGAAAALALMNMPPDAADEAADDLLKGFKEVIMGRYAALRKERGL